MLDSTRFDDGVLTKASLAHRAARPKKAKSKILYGAILRIATKEWKKRRRVTLLIIAQLHEV